MKKLCIALAATALLCLAGLGHAATTKANVVNFYQAYLSLVSASDYVPLSRDTPDAWDAKLNAIAKDAGFEDSAAALAAGADSATDSDVAALRQAVADEIALQYKPYRE